MTGSEPRLIDLIDEICTGEDVLFRSVRVAGDLMSVDVKTLTLADTVEACLKAMDDDDVRHIPVVDCPTGEEQSPCLVGIVSQRDVFRQVSPNVGKLGEEESDRGALRQPLARIVTRDPKSVSPETPIPGLVRTMLDHRIDAVPVVADENLVGMVTAGDVVRLFVRLDAMRRLGPRAQQEARPIDLFRKSKGQAAAFFSSVLRTVQDIMTDHVACLTPQDDVAAAIELMQKGGFRHVPVVGDKKRLLGIVSDRDVLRCLPFAGQEHPPRGEASGRNLFAADTGDPSLALSLRRVMTPSVSRVLPNCDIHDAATMLSDKRVSCLPVVDEEECLLGIVTVTDLMWALLAAYKVTAPSR